MKYRSVAIGAALALGPGLVAPATRARRISQDGLATMRDVRYVIEAEAAYQDANQGFYDKLECLHRPSECLAGYDGPVFLRGLLEPVQRRYLREFHPGPAAAVVPPGASPSSLESYAYVAIPVASGERGTDTGRDPAFCGDSTGVVCRTARAGRPAVTRGSCVVAPGSPPSFLRRWYEDLLDARPAMEPCYVHE